MARFEKGKSGNPAGKKPGTTNRTTQTFRAALTQSITVDDILIDIAATKEPSRRAELKIRLIEFCIPRLRSIEIREVPEIEQLLQLSQDELEKKIIQLKNEIGNGNKRTKAEDTGDD